MTIVKTHTRKTKKGRTMVKSHSRKNTDRLSIQSRARVEPVFTHKEAKQIAETYDVPHEDISLIQAKVSVGLLTVAGAIALLNATYGLPLGPAKGLLFLGIMAGAGALVTVDKRKLFEKLVRHKSKRVK